MFKPRKSRWIYEYIREYPGLTPHELVRRFNAKYNSWNLQEIDQILWQLEELGYLRQDDDHWFYAARWSPR